MGNEIQKWTPREGRIAELRRYQETRLQVKTNSRLIPANNLPGEVIDLLRICAVHDKPYVARYILGADGVYRFSQTIQITKRSHRDQYEGNAQSHLVDSRNFAGDEACALVPCASRGGWWFEVGSVRFVPYGNLLRTHHCGRLLLLSSQLRETRTAGPAVTPITTGIPA